MASVIYEKNGETIGHTPLVRLRKVVPSGLCPIYAKLESRTPGFSTKDRAAASMISEAERCGELRPGMAIVEPTSGNTGIGLAVIGATKGYNVTIVMPETMSVERRLTMKACGATVMLTDGKRGMKGAIERAEELCASGNFWMARQFDNPANPLAHERSTGPELWDALGSSSSSGKLGAVVAGVGTGGTLSGIMHYVKAKDSAVAGVAVEPAVSPVITQYLRGEPLCPGAHKIQGIGAGFVPGNLDLRVVDYVETVRGDDAIAMAARIGREEGILCGVSSGAAAIAAIQFAKKMADPTKAIVVIFPDSAERYLSSGLLDQETARKARDAKAGDTF